MLHVPHVVTETFAFEIISVVHTYCFFNLTRLKAVVDEILPSQLNGSRGVVTAGSIKLNDARCAAIAVK